MKNSKPCRCRVRLISARFFGPDMSRPLTSLSLTVVVTAAAALVVVPAVEGADAQGMPAEPGMILVHDNGDFNTQAFYPNGTFAFDHWLDEIGWYNPVAIHPNGRIALTGYVNDAVTVFHPNGTFAFSFGSLGLEPGELYSISSVAVDPSPSGGFIVGDVRGIHAFHPNGTFAFPFEPGYNEGVNREVAVSSDGRVFAANGRLVDVFHPNGTFAFAFGPNGTFTEGAVYERDLFDFITGITVGPDDRVFVFGFSTGEVYHPNGTFANTTFPVNGEISAVGSDGRGSHA